MKSIIRSAVSLVLVLVFLSSAFADDSFLNESPQDRDQRMQWWRNDRFGMFIHWGLYSVPAGEWKGGTGHAEWIRTTAKIPRDEYDKFRDQFNPVKFDAEQWVKMAKNAGMKYIVITSKHHDGFCLWDSKVTDFDIVDGTPFKRDILRELTDACEKYGIKMCLYHSIMDWHHPDYLPRRGWEDWSAQGADFDRYVKYMKTQLKEIITAYNPGILWFDGEWENTWTHERGLDLYNYVRSLKPDIIINNRADKGRQGMQGMTREGQFAGDYGTPEQEIPATGIPGVDWESCMTMNGYWGWNKTDKNFKSSTDLIRKLVDIASKGGNFLLNIGPKPDGTFPQESIDRLEQIGKWMNVYSDSIYGTTASPFERLPWGRCTKKQQGGKTLLYLHVFDWPANNRLLVPGLKNKIDSAHLLDGNVSIKFDTVENGITLHVPGEPKNIVDTVIILQISEPLKVEKVLPTQDENGVVSLSVAETKIHNDKNTNLHVRVETKNGHENIGFWTDYKNTVSWQFKIRTSGSFNIKADMASISDSRFSVSLNKKSFDAGADSTGGYERFKVQQLCQTSLLTPGDYTLEIVPDKDKWAPINIRSITIEPAK